MNALKLKMNVREVIINSLRGEEISISRGTAEQRDILDLKSKAASLANDLGDILPQGGHVTFPEAVKPCRLISFIPRVVSTNYELAPAIIKKCNFAARAPRSSLNALTISYPVSPPEVYTRGGV